MKLKKNVLIKKIYTSFIRFIDLRKKKYQYISKGNTKWALISYIPEVYYNGNDENYMQGHQNRREALIIGEVFKKLKYNYLVIKYNEDVKVVNRKFDVVFGIEPNFCNAARINNQALKIYYATGAYFKHQNEMVITRTNFFNQTHSTNLPLTRIVSEHDSCELADHILQIGSNFTIETYPKHLQKKITLINQSSNWDRDFDLDKRLESIKRTEFIWFGSSGSILKGLDLVLDLFIDNPHLILHIVGPIDSAFMNYYANRIIKASNIRFYGYLNIYSEVFKGLINRVAFNIFPSGSEGCPGSVITLMKLGIIPILSRWASFSEIDQYGFRLDAIDKNSLNDAISWASSLSIEEIKDLSIKNSEYAHAKWTLENFRSEFEFFLLNSLKKYQV